MGTSINLIDALEWALDPSLDMEDDDGKLWPELTTATEILDKSFVLTEDQFMDLIYRLEVQARDIHRQIPPDAITAEEKAFARGYVAAAKKLRQMYPQWKNLP